MGINMYQTCLVPKTCLVPGLILLLYAMCSRVEGAKKEICYQLDEETICFNNEAPFNNAGGKLPKSPEEIDTKFFLYTLSGAEVTTEEIKRDSLSQVAALIKNTETKIFIHGYTDSYDSQWIQLIAQSVKSQADVNFIAVDWSKGSTETYFQSVANSRLVGVEVALFVKALERDCSIPPVEVHLLGHSLGAHTAGYAGKLLPNLRRISGLDPSGPTFYTDNPLVRLSKHDAQYVDVIHTDDTGFGIPDQLGHADFYVNTGKHQPQCPVIDSFVDIIKTFKVDFQFGVGCNHVRVLVLLVMDVLGTCKYMGRPCEPGHVCHTCGKGCVQMGFYSELDSACGTYYVPTTNSTPFC